MVEGAIFLRGEGGGGGGGGLGAKLTVAKPYGCGDTKPVVLQNQYHCKMVGSVTYSVLLI